MGQIPEMPHPSSLPMSSLLMSSLPLTLEALQRHHHQDGGWDSNILWT